MVEKLGTAAWQNTWPPPGRKKFWQEGIEFWQDEVVGPPLKNDPDRPMVESAYFLLALSQVRFYKDTVLNKRLNTVSRFEIRTQTQRL